MQLYVYKISQDNIQLSGDPLFKFHKQVDLQDNEEFNNTVSS